MSPRRNWDSPNPSLAGECALPPRKGWGWGHTRLRLRGWGNPNSDDRIFATSMVDKKPFSHFRGDRLDLPPTKYL